MKKDKIICFIIFIIIICALIKCSSSISNEFYKSTKKKNKNKKIKKKKNNKLSTEAIIGIIIGSICFIVIIIASIFMISKSRIDKRKKTQELWDEYNKLTKILESSPSYVDQILPDHETKTYGDRICELEEILPIISTSKHDICVGNISIDA